MNPTHCCRILIGSLFTGVNRGVCLCSCVCVCACVRVYTWDKIAPRPDTCLY